MGLTPNKIWYYNNRGGDSMLSERDRLFCQRYYMEFVKEKSVKLSDLFAEIYPEISSTVARENRTKAEKLLKKQDFKDEIAKYNQVDSVDLGNEEAIKDFVKQQLLNMYKQASTLVRKSDRNGNPTEELKYLDGTTAIKSLELLGKGTSLFKERTVIETDTWEIK